MFYKQLFEDKQCEYDQKKYELTRLELEMHALQFVPQSPPPQPFTNKRPNMPLDIPHVQQPFTNKLQLINFQTFLWPFLMFNNYLQQFNYLNSQNHPCL